MHNLLFMAFEKRALLLILHGFYTTRAEYVDNVVHSLTKPAMHQNLLIKRLKLDHFPHRGALQFISFLSGENPETTDDSEVQIPARKAFKRPRPRPLVHNRSTLYAVSSGKSNYKSQNENSHPNR